jgi:hypothetical protein
MLPDRGFELLPLALAAQSALAPCPGLAETVAGSGCRCCFDHWPKLAALSALAAVAGAAQVRAVAVAWLQAKMHAFDGVQDAA